MAGWIKIHQAIQEHWIWENPMHLKWWLDLLMLAEWKDRKVMIKGKPAFIKRGQLAASLRYLAERWAYRKDMEQKKSPLVKPQQRTVMKFLKMLEADKMIERNFEILPNRTALITICNYERYQQIQTPPCSTMGSTLGSTECSTECSKEEEYIDYIDYSSTTTIEEQREISLCEELRSDRNRGFWEQSCMALHCEMETLDNLLTDFTSEIIATQKWHTKGLEDFRRHFYSWARIAIKEQRKTNNQNGRNQNPSPADAADIARQRRGREYEALLASKLGKIINS